MDARHPQRGRGQVDPSLQNSVWGEAVASRQHGPELAPLRSPLLLHESMIRFVPLLRLTQPVACGTRK
eukprot:14605071-Alexandrium_andersonii.AAC.1